MSRIVLSLSVIVGLNYFIACCHDDNRQPVDPSKVVVVCANNDAAAQQPDEFDAGPSMEGAALTEKTVCHEACRTLATVGCPESKKLPEGKDCETNCKDIRKISSYDPYCVARAKTKEQVRKCPQIECK